MSLLYARVQREAMAWRNNPGEHHPVVHSVHKAGFGGYVDMSPERMEDDGRHEDEDGGWDEDLHEETRPEPTPEEKDHFDEHGEYPEEYEDRHAQAYEEGLRRKKQESRPDHEDDELMDFIGNHGTDHHFWDEHAKHEPVDIKNQPVYATQSHVSQGHIDKYLHSPHAEVHEPSYSGNYKGDEAPMVVTHNGRLHTIEGHHRMAAALQRGDSHIDAWHFNADEHGGLPDSEGHMPDHEDYEEYGY